MACALLILLSGLDADWRAYAILGGWAAIGTLYWFVYGRHASLSMRNRLAASEFHHRQQAQEPMPPRSLTPENAPR
jgi:hypothetical protein